MDSQTVEGAPATVLVDLERDNVEGGDETQTPKSKRAKMTTADCWKFFTKLGPVADGVERSKCNGCGKVFRAGGSNHGTSSLNRHWPKCDKIKSADICQVMIDMQGKLKNLAIDKKVYREMCAMTIIAHYLPYNFVEFQYIRNWLKYLNPDFAAITRNTATADVERDNVEGGDETQTPESKRAKMTTADCCKFFTKLGPSADGVERSKCNGCGKVFRAGGSNHGTSSLNRHWPKCDKIKSADIGQVMIDMQGKLKNLAIDKKVSREMCAMTIIGHYLPYNFVEFQYIRNWLKYLNPDFAAISRNTATADVASIHKREKEILKQELANIPTRISLTSDLWTTCTTEGYICLTAHYVNSNWNLKSRILNFSHMPPPHSGSELSKKIFEFISDWGIEK
ncbi:hypothetical protein QL285_020357 [Trifolium repens]|nr:hypothetical protein QL285_020357 [Trifolium repens]